MFLVTLAFLCGASCACCKLVHAWYVPRLQEQRVADGIGPLEASGALWEVALGVEIIGGGDYCRVYLVYPCTVCSVLMLGWAHNCAAQHCMPA